MSAKSSGTVRFLATLPTAARTQVLAAVAELGLDRLPDARGRIQLLISADDARRLLDKGIEVHLHAAIPVAPLEKRLILSDEQARNALEKRLKGVPRKGGN